MTKFYKIANEAKLPDSDFELNNLGIQIKFNRLVNHGHGHIRTEYAYRKTTSDDYDKTFVKRISDITPIFKMADLLNFHFDNYEGDKNEYLAHIKYLILPLMKKEKNSEGHIDLVNDWLAKKETKQNPTVNHIHNYNIKTGDVNAPTQFQQNSDNSVQNQTLNYNEAMVKNLFEVLETDIEKLATDIKEEFSSKMSYALKQIKQGKDIRSQLLNIGSLISNVGLPFFVNLVSSGVFEVMKPYLGIP